MKHIAPFLKNTKYKVGDYIIYEMNYLDHPDIYKIANIFKISKYITSPYYVLDEDGEVKNLLPDKIIRKNRTLKSQVLHIGDNLTADCNGAKAFGFSTLHFKN